MPQLFIITGSNGAGKSSVGPSLLPPNVVETISVFDGDKLYGEKHTQLYLARKHTKSEMREIANNFVTSTFARLVENAIESNSDFAYEGHFTTIETWDIPGRFKNAGYTIHLIFLGLEDTEISKMRVRARVDEGGHNVPLYDIENNFYGNLTGLNRHYQLFDRLTVMDTSGTIPIVLADFDQGKNVYLVDRGKLPDWFTRYLPALLHG